MMNSSSANALPVKGNVMASIVHGGDSIQGRVVEATTVHPTTPVIASATGYPAQSSVKSSTIAQALPVSDPSLQEHSSPMDAKRKHRSSVSYTNDKLDVALSMSVTHRIAKTDVTCPRISQEALAALTKSAELFIECFVEETAKKTMMEKRKTIKSEDAESTASRLRKFQFLSMYFMSQSPKQN